MAQFKCFGRLCGVKNHKVTKSLYDERIVNGNELWDASVMEKFVGGKSHCECVNYVNESTDEAKALGVQRTFLQQI